MIKYIYLFVLLSLLACNKSQSIVISETPKIDSIIHLADAIDVMQDVNLSVIADSVTYLPLSTKNCLLGKYLCFRFSDKYIYSSRYVFDWNGKLLHNIGKVGQGPGEEPERILSQLIDKPDCFYSIGTKLIKYSSKGEYSGQECRYDALTEIANAKSNLALFMVDTVLFITPQFELISAQRVIKPWPTKCHIVSGNQVIRYFTENNNRSVFYNYDNDTIFHVGDSALEPLWIIDLKDKKIPMEIHLGNFGKMLEEGSQFYVAGKLEEWDYLKLTDGKINSFAVYETKDFVFILWVKMFDFASLRGKEESYMQIAYYNKQTGKTIAVGDRGFIDDLSLLGERFYPAWGTHGNCLVASYWPYELREKAEKLKSKGKPIDKNLESVLSKVTDDDNPILVLAHLKK